MHEVKSESEVSQSCPTLCDPMDHSLPGSSIHGIFQARGLEWVAIALSTIIEYWNDQEISGVTGKFDLEVQNEAGQRLAEFCQETELVIANTLFLQHKRILYTWTSADGQYWNQVDDILCSKRCRSSIQSAKTRPGADCDSDHEHLIAKFRLKLNKVGKTTRPFRCELNQVLYDYIVEVTNRFKGLDLIDSLKNDGWRFMTAYRRQWPRLFLRKRNVKRQKWLSEEALQIAENRRELEGKGEKERYTHLNAEFQRVARRDKKAFLSNQRKEIEENNRMGKVRDLFKKIRDTKGTFHAKMGSKKELRNSKDLTEADEIKKRWQEYTKGLC